MCIVCEKDKSKGSNFFWNEQGATVLFFLSNSQKLVYIKGYILNPAGRYILACLDAPFVLFAQSRSSLRSFSQRTKCIVNPSQFYIV